MPKEKIGKYYLFKLQLFFFITFQECIRLIIKMNGSVTQLTGLNNYNSTACKNASFHYLFLCYFTTTAAMFQLCLCYQKWECYGEKCLQTLTFPLLHHAGLLWKTPHYLSLTVAESSSIWKICRLHCFKLSVLLAQEDPELKVARMT